MKKKCVGAQPPSVHLVYYADDTLVFAGGVDFERTILVEKIE